MSGSVGGKRVSCIVCGQRFLRNWQYRMTIEMRNENKQLKREIEIETLEIKGNETKIER